jgi:hypothetical protein
MVTPPLMTDFTKKNYVNLFGRNPELGGRDLMLRESSARRLSSSR